MGTSTVLANGQQFEHGHAPIQTRSQRLKSASVSDYGPISKREEQWKYTTSDQLAGLDSDSLTTFKGKVETTGSAEIQWVSKSDSRFGSVGIPEDRVSAAAWQSVENALLISVPASETHGVSTVVIAPGAKTPTGIHIIVDAPEGSNHTVVLNHMGVGVLAENIEILGGAGSNLTVVSLQNWETGSVHVASHFAKIAKDGNLKHIVVTLGGDVVRISPMAEFTGSNASVSLFGLYFAAGGQHLEHRLFVDHATPNCKSRVTYKGALQGDKAHTIWVGDVLIRAAAEGTDTYELNRNLLLTDGARADSVPNLEIETGQIEGAGHASASGRFDDEQLFYLQARGIKPSDARRLVVRGFLNEIIQQIDHEPLQEQLIDTVDQLLEEGSN